MGFLDRFKKQKEQEMEKTASSSVVVENKIEEKPKAKKTVKKLEDKEEKTVKVVKSSKKIVPEALSNVLICPLVTEKSATLASVGQYVFEINSRANRLQVAQAFKAVYGIAPAKVQIQNIRREPVRFGRFHGKQKSWKKAIVCLPKGKTINVHEGI